jgi:hypothetical protein
MINDVKIMRPGEPTRIITGEELHKRLWKKEAVHFVKPLTPAQVATRRARNVGPREHTCLTCKKTFSALGDRSYCHNPCYYTDARHIPLKDQIRYCSQCKDPYTPTCSNQKRCNNPCKSKQYVNSSVHFGTTSTLCNTPTTDLIPVLSTDETKVNCGNCHRIMRKK